MKELKSKCHALKLEAIKLMQEGKLSAYLAKLKEVSDIQIQMAQLTTAA
jgi:hypothetical protein